MRARAAILALILLGGAAALGPVSRACGCPEDPRTPEQALPAYDAVFLGQTLAITISPTGSASAPHQKEMVDRLDVTVKVLETWKGSPAPGDHVLVHTNPDTASCGYPFQVGKTSLVWATEASGVLTTSVCDRTKATGTIEAETDLRHLRDLAETWTWHRVQAAGFTVLLPDGFAADALPFDLPEDVTRWQTIWWKPLDPARSGGWSNLGLKISYEYLGATASVAPLPKLESTVAGKAATMRHVALPNGRRVMSVYWVGPKSSSETLVLHCDVDPVHDVCTRVADSIQW
jgi:hypothetical protein